MSEQYAGHQIVGMDLHRRRSVLVRMGEEKIDGKREASRPGGRLPAVLWVMGERE